ncbi:hypothetical protein [Azospirillum ramasamyi]|uniref:Uncharacterized protein n=1 Tax=Azospirillum ramasamyi TaxID=682998 RepID=A0A2U9S859_9PROT|nr:hypothetical protein [Azospirillum ramasamyi]AWU95745.1 hypothetical protein DM194_15810 [Azospirillum ramasamyi]
MASYRQARDLLIAWSAALTLLAVFADGAGAGAGEPAPPLPPRNIVIEKSSASGLAAGAFMALQFPALQFPALQFHVAHSSEITGAGFNRWAANNNLIVLYPQLSPRRSADPIACRDWIGTTGADYAMKGGAKIAAVHAMLTTLAGQR